MTNTKHTVKARVESSSSISFLTRRSSRVPVSGTNEVEFLHATALHGLATFLNQVCQVQMEKQLNISYF